MSLGVSLPTFVDRGGAIGDIPALARHVEQAGLDAVWAGDHLSARTPFLESVVALTAAAAVTERVRIGFGVLLLALRQQAWVARQLASLQYLSGNRVLLGVGAGFDPDEWPAAGIPFAGRGRRTDRMLRTLPALFAGEPTPLSTEPGAPVLRLEPAVPAPPVWVGGMSDRALRRALDHGAGWLASLLTPAELAERAAVSAAMADAAGVRAPEVGTTVFAALSTDSAGARYGRERVVRFLRSLTGEAGLSERAADRLVVSGPPEQLAERLDQYLRAGASTFVVNLSGEDLPRQYELLAATRELLRDAQPVR
ncbi:LLM class flavin-dependent oxidoreductase [Nocardia sp. CDC159]|uniref:LLM class flavin-dependent oxidoreductase n=1 Tax=Nocardia pulmonis TaxID=2951408 RepID=A0A9X2E427_9NOCA|nr:MULTISPECIES: LLM class flavin-dependent oxidoreductase [Nocardia]MCM6773747.1 LLM class flavin-dependent oxidoreductase [Nocardia pulmonis]MCM6786634.1 LLM class flavin-dependent oxidoreductase [Nocardia sp. CDC159]